MSEREVTRSDMQEQRYTYSGIIGGDNAIKVTSIYELGVRVVAVGVKKGVFLSVELVKYFYSSFYFSILL
jgi:hypothetical protein